MVLGRVPANVPDVCWEATLLASSFLAKLTGYAHRSPGPNFTAVSSLAIFVGASKTVCSGLPSVWIYLFSMVDATDLVALRQIHGALNIKLRV
jgi:hypothetical protein